MMLQGSEAGMLNSFVLDTAIGMQQQPHSNEAAAVAIPLIRNWRRECGSIGLCIMDSP
jgi:hypothetical protein